MRLNAREVVEFSVITGLAAILVDAVLAHGLFWENDPYWTYWITKTLLITTVFALGTAFFGIGIRQGLAITAVHTLILEIYYEWFAPVGLPQEPEWLDFNHLWTTGVPAHYLSILGGYLFALWFWRRREWLLGTDLPPRRAAIFTLIATIIVLLLDGLVTHAVLMRQFPGLTYFIQHLLVAAVVIFAWTVNVGWDRRGWLAGAATLAIVWTGYNMFVGPLGLPFETPRYMGYVDLWSKAFPGALVAALGGTWAANRFFGRSLPKLDRRLASIILLASLALFVPNAEAAGLRAQATASGAAKMVTGNDPVSMTNAQPVTGSITISTTDHGNRWSHLQNIDEMKVVAEWVGGGHRYKVTMDKPMPRHPLGRYTTWSGVVYNHEMHGDTGIGTAKLPKLRPQIALWGWAEVQMDGKVISRMASGHVMVTQAGAMPGVMLEIETEDKALLGAPDYYLTIMWPKVSSLSMPEKEVRSRRIIGWIGMILFVAAFWWLAATEPIRGQTRITRG